MRRPPPLVAGALRACLGVALAAALAACPARRSGGVEPPSDPDPGREQSLALILLRDLEIEVLEGYELPTFETAVPPTAVSSRVGAVHIGVRPEDVAAGRGGTVDRWPLLPRDELGARLDRALSKRLEMHLSRDLTTAWIADEVSFRIPGCVGQHGYKTAVIPLRLTAVYVRDGERWVQVLEHVSYPQRIGELVERAGPEPVGAALGKRRDPRGEAHAVVRAVERAVAPDLGDDERQRLYAAGRDALALWVDPGQELRGSAVVSAASLARMFDAASVTLEGWRAGMSPDPTGGTGPGTVAWVAANLKIEARRPRPDGELELVPVRLRATYVLERRDGRWTIVQSHVSAPITDQALLVALLGPTATEGGLDPWRRPCEGSWTGRR